MIVRLIITISLFAVGWHYGGANGIYAMLLLLGFLGLIFPYRVRSSELAEYEAQGRVYEKIDRARRGSAYDPTRPGYDEHPLLLTNQYRRMK